MTDSPSVRDWLMMNKKLVDDKRLLAFNAPAIQYAPPDAWLDAFAYRNLVDALPTRYSLWNSLMGGNLRSRLSRRISSSSWPCVTGSWYSCQFSHQSTTCYIHDLLQVGCHSIYMLAPNKWQSAAMYNNHEVHSISPPTPDAIPHSNRWVPHSTHAIIWHVHTYIVDDNIIVDYLDSYFHRLRLGAPKSCSIRLSKQEPRGFAKTAAAAVGTAVGGWCRGRWNGRHAYKRVSLVNRLSCRDCQFTLAISDNRVAVLISFN